MMDQNVTSPPLDQSDGNEVIKSIPSGITYRTELLCVTVIGGRDGVHDERVESQVHVSILNTLSSILC